MTPAPPPADRDVLCALRGVDKEFPQPGGQPLKVLQDITLEIRADEVVALLGPSGCGKSTILRILCGLTEPTRGEVTAHGAPLRGLHPGVGFVFQGAALFPWMTVQQNVRSMLRARGLPAAEVAGRAERAIRMVGLSGFEEAYPRELSGGMKQRVGMARAFSLEPELLFLDEPFSQVDALTAESLRAEVLDVWAPHDSHPRSIVLVSHDIPEVAFMADRIVVLDAKPGRVRTVVENRLPRPRDYRSSELLRLVDELHDVITGMRMPDAAAPEPAGAYEPLPHVPAAEIAGLLEYLDARGGREDVFRIAASLGQEFGRVITATNAAELLGFVETPQRTVALAAQGLRFVRASPADRKAIFRERIRPLRLFAAVEQALAQGPAPGLDRDFVLELVALHLPAESLEASLATFLDWARFADLFAYDDATGRLRSQ